MVVEGRIRVAVNADQLGRDALPYFRMMLRFGQDDESGVGVHIYEAGRHDMVGGVNRARCFDAAQVAAEDTHRIALDTHRAVEARIAGAVYDQSISD